MAASSSEGIMDRRESAKPAKRERAGHGSRHEKGSIRDLWKDMWAGTDETNRRLRWRRWDRDLDFR